MNKKKIAQYSALAVGLTSTTILSCNDSNSGMDDNPNIISRDLNVTVFDFNSSDNIFDNQYAYIDIDENGVDDAFIFIAYNKFNNIRELYGQIYCTPIDDNDFPSEFTSYNVDADIYDIYYQITENKNVGLLKSVNANEEINNNTNTFYVAYSHLIQYQLSNKITSLDNEFRGKGDKFFGFKFFRNTQKHFGWMRINLANDGKSMTIKEIAYNINADTPIKIGEK